MKDNVYIECQCSSDEHLMILKDVVDEDFACVIVSMHLAPLPWYKRIIHAIRYIFGYRNAYGDFAEIILDKKQVTKIQVFLQNTINKTQQVGVNTTDLPEGV